MESRTIRIGTRKSQLAMIQAEYVQATMQKMYPKRKFEIVAMSTTGDQILDKALNKIGEKNLFTKELEIALEERKVDLIVHSLKDLPSTLPDKMVIGAIMEREDPRDVLIVRQDLKGKTLDTLPEGAIIGTSAVRRSAQFKSNYPQYSYRNIRGNLNTRLRKLDNQEGENYCAMILAAAGVNRMGWADRISQHIDIGTCMHAVGQGALGIECLQHDVEVLTLLSKLNHVPTLAACVAERAVMRKLEGGCSAPVASHAQLIQGTRRLAVKAGVWSLDGSRNVVLENEVELAEWVEGSVSQGNGDVTSKAPSANGKETVIEEEDVGRDLDKLYSSVSCENSLQVTLAIAESCGIGLANRMLDTGAGKILEEAKIETAKAT